MASELEMALEKMQKHIDRQLRLKPLFDNELFKEWMEILNKKIEAYRIQSENAPRIGDIKYMEQISINGDRKEVTKIPYRINMEEQNEIKGEFEHRISELKMIIDIPKLLEKDVIRMSAEIEKIKSLSKESK